MIERLPLSNSRKFDVGPASPKAGPMLLIAEIDPLRAVTKSSLKKNVNETVPIITKEINRAIKPSIEATTFSSIFSLPTFIGYSPLGLRINFNSLERALKPICIRKIFIPPAVEPKVPPTVIRNRSNN